MRSFAIFLLSRRIATIISIIWLFNLNVFLFVSVNKIKQPDDPWWLSNSRWATLTSYPFLADHQINKQKEDLQCKVVHVFAYFRHGTRYPHQVYVDQYAEMAKKAESLCNELTAKYANEPLPRFCHPYKIPEAFQSDALLSEVGKEELRSIGSRLKKIIKSDSVDIDVRSSFSKRSQESAIQFFLGFDSNIRPNLTCDDDLLRFYRPQKKSDKNNFLTSSIWNQTVETFSEFLKYSVTKKDLMNIYGACALGKINNLMDEMLMWCSMMPKSTLDAILYAKDAEEYWILEAYSNNVSDPIFSLFQNILNTTLSQQVNKPSGATTVKPKITLLFGHHLGVTLLLKRLRLFEQNGALSAENYADYVNNRGLNLTLIAPMAANLQLRVYLCNNQLYFEPFLNEISMLQKVDCKGKNSFGCPASTFSSILL